MANFVNSQFSALFARSLAHPFLLSRFQPSGLIENHSLASAGRTSLRKCLKVIWGLSTLPTLPSRRQFPRNRHLPPCVSPFALRASPCQCPETDALWRFRKIAFARIWGTNFKRAPTPKRLAPALYLFICWWRLLFGCASASIWAGCQFDIPPHTRCTIYEPTFFRCLWRRRDPATTR